MHGTDCLTEALVTTHAVHCCIAARLTVTTTTRTWGWWGQTQKVGEAGVHSLCDRRSSFILAPFDFVFRAYVNNQTDPCTKNNHLMFASHEPRLSHEHRAG